MSEFIIRPYNHDDASSLAECQRAAADISLKPIYGEEAIEYWKGRITPEKFKHTTEYQLVAVVGGEIVGFSSCDLAEGTIGMWYVHPDFHGQGIGKALLAKAESRLWEAGFQKIKTYASKYAEPRFQKLGWEVKERLDRKLGPHHFPVAHMTKLYALRVLNEITAATGF